MFSGLIDWGTVKWGEQTVHCLAAGARGGAEPLQPEVHGVRAGGGPGPGPARRGHQVRHRAGRGGAAAGGPHHHLPHPGRLLQNQIVFAIIIFEGRCCPWCTCGRPSTSSTGRTPRPSSPTTSRTGTGVQGYWGAGVHVDCCYRQLTTEERLLQWGAANNVKIKVSSVTVVSILTWWPGLRSPGPGPPPPGTRCGAPASCPPAGGPAAGSCSWSTPRWRGKYLCHHIKIFTLHLQADPCTSLYDLACGGWVKNVTSGRGSVGSLATVSVMDENKLEVDKKIRGEHLTFVICPPPLRCVQTSYWHCRTPGPRPPPLDRISGARLRHSTGAARTRRPSSGWATPPPWSSCTTPSAGTWTPPCPTPGTSPRS